MLFKSEYRQNESDKVKSRLVKSNEFFEINFDQINTESNRYAVHERYLEEISKLKAKIKSLETLVNRCKFDKSLHQPKAESMLTFSYIILFCKAVSCMS